jgi:glutathione S-transferase
MANKYAPELYGATAEAKGIVDWALDWCSSNFYKSYAELWYPVAGFGPAPEDFPAACKKATDNLDTFCAKFLAGDNKFVGGSQVTIADYKIAAWLWYLGHPAVKATTGFELSARCAAYVQDFLGASKSARSYLEGVPKGFMDSKLTPA